MNILDNFTEIQNTNASKALLSKEREEGLSIRFSKVKGTGTDKNYVAAFLSKSLIECLKEKGLDTFKFLFNEKSKEIALVLDKSSNAIDINSYTVQPNGTVSMINKYITATMLDLMYHLGDLKSIKYIGKYNAGLLAILLKREK